MCVSAVRRPFAFFHSAAFTQHFFSTVFSHRRQIVNFMRAANRAKTKAMCFVHVKTLCLLNVIENGRRKNARKVTSAMNNVSVVGCRCENAIAQNICGHSDEPNRPKVGRETRAKKSGKFRASTLRWSGADRRRSYVVGVV